MNTRTANARDRRPTVQDAEARRNVALRQAMACEYMPRLVRHDRLPVRAERQLEAMGQSILRQAELETRKLRQARADKRAKRDAKPDKLDAARQAGETFVYSDGIHGRREYEAPCPEHLRRERERRAEEARIREWLAS